MLKVTTTSPALKPYLFHGVELDDRPGSENATGDCPFCGKSGKFAVHSGNGLWRCLVCNAGSESDKVNKGGNVLTFLRLFHRLCEDATTTADHEELARDRKLLDANTPMIWGCAKSIFGDEWLVPGYDAEGRIVQLYRYARNPVTGKRALLATPTLGHGMFRPAGFRPERETIYLNEGPWDGMALWEVLRSAKPNGEGDLVHTANEEASLLSASNVLAAPGCNAFSDTWLPVFAGKNVVLLFDNDHPKAHPKTGVLGEGAGPAGMRRVSRVLLQSSEPPESVSYLRWGEGVEGFPDFNPLYPSGFDIRDLLSAGGEEASKRVVGVQRLIESVIPVPPQWVPGRTADAKKTGGAEVECLPCNSWKSLTNSWRKAMKWTEGLDRALSVMLSSILSTKSVGDQLWCKIIGPPSCGKSVLCEALSVNRKYVLAKSTIRGFHSGFQSDRAGAEDNSLAHIVRDKTLITKDGDTLLTSPNLPQILSEARDVYDRTSRTHYRNKMSRDYEGLSMTWLLCGTESLRCLDSSELGERFLDCVVVEEMDPDLEREIGWRVALRAQREMSYVSNGKAESSEGPELVEAKRLTGGYINYLRGNAQELLMSVEASESSLRKCQRLAEFVSFMRARPSKKQEEKAQRELSFRLISQHVRLATCLAVVMNRSSIDDEVMRRVARVALDTARGRTLNIARELFTSGEKGMSLGALAVMTNETEAKERDLLIFLRKIGAVEKFSVKTAGVTGRPKYRLTERLSALYEAAVTNGGAEEIVDGGEGI